jgi:hypothetical protein
MPVRSFRVSGEVTDINTRKGAPDLRVEVWDHDDPGHTLYGATVTDASGRFEATATVDLPQVVTGAVPAILKVFQQTQPLPATGDTRISNLFTQTAPLNLSVNAQAQPPAVTDKIGLSQVLGAVDFVRLSDFKGVFKEGRDRFSSTTSVLRDSLKSVIGSVQVKPIKPPSVRASDVVRQDSTTATTRLQTQGVTVTAVKPYTADASGLSLLTSLPATFKQGDKVELYQENGVVRGYKILRDTPTRVDPATVNQLQTNVDNLQSKLDAKSAQVDQLQTQLTAKSNQIDQLQSQLTTRAAQVDQLSTQIAALQVAHNQLAAVAAKNTDLTALQETMKTVKTRLQIP